METGTDKIKYAKMIKVLKVSKRRYRRLKKKKEDYYKRNRPRKICTGYKRDVVFSFVLLSIKKKKINNIKQIIKHLKILAKLLNFMQNVNFSLFFLFRSSIGY